MSAENDELRARLAKDRADATAALATLDRVVSTWLDSATKESARMECYEALSTLQIRLEDQKLIDKPVTGPYPWCRKPEECSKLGYCPRDPNCGE